MLTGTKKFFPNDYEGFKEAMLQAAEEGHLPATCRIEDVSGYELSDFRDLMYEVYRDTGLGVDICLTFCQQCGCMHMRIEVYIPDKQETNRILQ